MTKIDWTKPLEAYRARDGKVVPVTLRTTRGCHAPLGTRYTNECPNANEANHGWNEDGSSACIMKLWVIRNAVANALDTTKPLQTVDGKKVTFVGKLDDGRIVVEVTYGGWQKPVATELRYADGRKTRTPGITSGDDVVVKVVKKSVFLNVYSDGTIGQTKHKTKEAARHATKYGKVRVAILEQLFEDDVQVGARVNAAAAPWYRDARILGRAATREDYAR